MDEKDLIHHPAIIKMAENLWRPIKVEVDPNHRPPVVINGVIHGETNPPIVPQTPREIRAGMQLNLYRNITRAEPADPQSAAENQWTWPEKLLPALTPEDIKK